MVLAGLLILMVCGLLNLMSLLISDLKVSNDFHALDCTQPAYSPCGSESLFVLTARLATGPPGVMAFWAILPKRLTSDNVWHQTVDSSDPHCPAVALAGLNGLLFL